jgi:restriction endonuclease S subunit
MAVWSTIRFTDLSGINRIDGEYFDEKYLELERNLNKQKLLPITSLVNVSDGNHMSISKYFTNEVDSVPYYRGQDINDFFLENAEPYRIKNEAFEKGWMKRSYFLPGDVLLSIVGTVGSLSIVPETITKSTGSCKIAILRPKADVDPNFISAFLLSKYGQYQIKRNVRGAVQTGLILKDMVHIKVPIIERDDMNNIASKIKEATKLNHKSKSLYTEATQLLEQELGFDKISFEKPRSYTARFSEVIDGKRADGEFYNPELKNYYQHFADKMKMELKPLTQFTKVIKFSNPDYASEGVPIITQKHLTNISPEGYIGFPIASQEWVSKNPTAVLRENDLLFYSVGAYLGKTNIWFSEDKAVHASFITMLRSENKYDAGYLMVLLNSKFGILQSKVFQSGSSQPYIYPKDIRQFLVPEVDNKLKTRLYELIRESYDAKIESQRLLEQAKSRVEELIEQSIQANA